MNTREVIRDALGILGVIGATDEVQAEDYELGLRTLNLLLKELPLNGYAWPNLSLVDAPLTWSVGAPSYVTAPVDYWSDMQINRTDANGKRIPVKPMTRAQWQATTDKTATGTPTHFYQEVNSRLMLWPVPTSDPGLLASYIAIPDSPVFNTPPDVPEAWTLGLQWGLAAHLAPHYEKDPRPFFAMWDVKRPLMLANGVESAAVVFEVID